LVVDGCFAAGWRVVRDMDRRRRRLVQSAAKPNMRRKTNPPELLKRDGNNRITPDYPIIAFEIFHGKRWASLRSAPTYDLAQHTRYYHLQAAIYNMLHYYFPYVVTSN
jgi:hypothetical protein